MTWRLLPRPLSAPASRSAEGPGLTDLPGPLLQRVLLSAGLPAAAAAARACRALQQAWQSGLQDTGLAAGALLEWASRPPAASPAASLPAGQPASQPDGASNTQPEASALWPHCPACALAAEAGAGAWAGPGASRCGGPVLRSLLAHAPQPAAALALLAERLAPTQALAQLPGSGRGPGLQLPRRARALGLLLAGAGCLGQAALPPPLLAACERLQGVVEVQAAAPAGPHEPQVRRPRAHASQFRQCSAGCILDTSQPCTCPLSPQLCPCYFYPCHLSSVRAYRQALREALGRANLAHIRAVDSVAAAGELLDALTQGLSRGLAAACRHGHTHVAGVLLGVVARPPRPWVPAVELAATRWLGPEGMRRRGLSEAMIAAAGSHAAQQGTELLRSVLAAGADANGPPGSAALAAATAAGNRAALRLLLDSGADPRRDTTAPVRAAATHLRLPAAMVLLRCTRRPCGRQLLGVMRAALGGSRAVSGAMAAASVPAAAAAALLLATSTMAGASFACTSHGIWVRRLGSLHGKRRGARGCRARKMRARPVPAGGGRGDGPRGAVDVAPPAPGDCGCLHGGQPGGGRGCSRDGQLSNARCAASAEAGGRAGAHEGASV
jgi:hypothetical protein